jgi:hypothetical protein
MTAPTFKTREELEAWAGKTLRKSVPFGRTARTLALEAIRRVTKAHEHLRRK